METRLVLKDLHINSFRGIKDLVLDGCSDINLILGDNNTGKTSIFEAIQLLNKDMAYELTQICFSRSINRISMIDFMYLFEEGKKEISIDANTSIGERHIKANYTLDEISFDQDLYLSGKPISKREMLKNYIKNMYQDGRKTSVAQTFLSVNETTNFSSIYPLDFLFDITRKSGSFDTKNNIIYQSPFSHYSIDDDFNILISQVVANENKEKLFISFLKLFDERIERILFIPKIEVFDGLSELCLQRKGENPIPLSAYGDGMKKMLKLLLNVMLAENGIFLIDEIETSVHHQYFNEVFSALIVIASKLNVQLFMSAHSAETIDKILECTKTMNKLDFINVYTLKRKDGKLLSRRLSGNKVMELKENINLEVR